MFKLFKRTPGKTYQVTGMHCASCAMVIESNLENVGIDAKCSYAKQTIEIKDHEFDEEKIKVVLKDLGYTLSPPITSS